MTYDEDALERLRQRLCPELTIEEIERIEERQIEEAEARDRRRERVRIIVPLISLAVSITALAYMIVRIITK